MTDIEDLTRQVEANPNDLEERWHLAKKLYMAGEYRTALGHLLVLQTNWTPKVNVLRYLAAAYYRLGRYDEAVTELRAGIAEWPEETTLREQLARVLEVAQRPTEAAEVWRDLLKIEPDHSLARQALARILDQRTGDVRSAASPDQSRLDIDLTPGRTCPNCGVQNSEEFDRCWKCHAPLTEGAAPDDMPLPQDTKTFKSPVRLTTVWYAAGIVVALALLAFDGYLSMGALFDMQTSAPDTRIFGSVRELFQVELLSTRIALSLILLVIWPVALWIGSAIVGSSPDAIKKSLVGGLLLASLASLSLWRPPAEIVYVFAACQGLALIPVAVFFRPGIGRVILVWLIQGVLVCAIALISVTALEGLVFVTEFPAIASYAQDFDSAHKDRARYLLPPLHLPVDASVQWESTGSTWLDGKADRVKFEITSPGAIPEIVVEIKDSKDSGGRPYYNHVTQVPFTFLYDDVMPGRSYQLLITGPEDAKIEMTVYGILKPRFG